MSEPILVTGATGNQGGAVVGALLGLGASVRAFVRDSDSKRARDLAAAGVELAEGDLTDTDTLTSAMSGVTAAYGLTVSGPEEIELGLSILDAAERASVPHLVLASVASADRTSTVPHFLSKARIERAAREGSVPTTVLAPTWFFENLLAQRSDLRAGTLALPLHTNRRLQCVALDDLGELAARVLLSAPMGAGERIEVAGDELTPEAMADILGRVVGRPVRAVRVAPEVVELRSSDLAAMYRFLEEVGYSVDIPALRARYPQIRWQHFSEWTDQQSWDS
jgi:uncharacterized protein YbjT (DUF2867 family)